MAKQPNDDLFHGTSMTFGEHLEELRVALFRALVGLMVGFIIGLVVAKHVVRWIQTPLKAALETHYSAKAKEDLERQYGELPEDTVSFFEQQKLTFEDLYIPLSEIHRIADVATGKVSAGGDMPEGFGETIGMPASRAEMIQARVWRPIDAKITTLSAQEAFMIWLKAGFVAGLLIGSPYIFWQIWNFVAAGLYQHERKFVYLFLPISLLLFWSGAALAFFFAFKHVLAFLLMFNRKMDIHSEPRISEWISFVLFLPLGFGIAFQLPLVMLFLNRIGIFSVTAYLQKWRIAVLVIFVISMLLTPADPISMLLMAGPLTVLYFLGIAFCHWMPRSRNPYGESARA